MEKKRLQKLLSEQGICSRRAAEDLIRAGDVLVEGKKAELGQKVTGEEKIVVKGKPIAVSKSSETLVLAWHKPLGVEVTFSTKHSDETLTAQKNFSAMKKTLGGRVIPVGRLDKDSHGLLLLTNDGELANQLAHPRYEHPKEYRVRVNYSVAAKQVETLSNGSLDLGEKTVSPCHVEIIEPNAIKIVLREGRNRQIRRMCEAVGLEVVELLRTRVGAIALGNLLPGNFRTLNTEEIEQLHGEKF